MSAASVIDWQWLTGAEFPDLDRERTVVYVSLSPLEVHGPHLPVITDVFESEALGDRVFEPLTQRHPELRILRLPPLFVAADVLPQTGSVSFRPSTVKRVVTDLGRTLSRQGFRHLWVGNFHGGPRHFVAIESACATCQRRFGIRSVSVFSLLINRLSRGRLELTEAFGDIEGLGGGVLDGDAHAGAIETSIMLHLVPDRVRRDWRSLPRRTLNTLLVERGREPIKHGGDDASFFDVVRWLVHSIRFYETEMYQGDPGAGRGEIGEAVLNRVVAATVEALSELWTGRLNERDARTPLYKLRFLLLNETVDRLMGWLAGFRRQV